MGPTRNKRLCSGSEVWPRSVVENLRGLQVIRRMYKVTNAQIRELGVVRKGVDERIDEGDLFWFSNMERMENDMIAKRVYVGVCAGSRSVGQQRKRRIDTVKNYLKKKKFGCQARKKNGV